MSKLAERLIDEVTKAFYTDRDKITAIMSKAGGGHVGEVWDRGSENLYISYSFPSQAAAMKGFAAAKGKYSWIKQDSIKPTKRYYGEPADTKRVVLRVIIPVDSYV